LARRYRETTIRGGAAARGDRLQDGLAKVRTLSGMLPICANCKKIRDDKGYWNQIEGYMQDHSEVDFSHCLCPECEKSCIRIIMKMISFQDRERYLEA